MTQTIQQPGGSGTGSSTPSRSALVTGIELITARVPFSDIARQAMDESTTGLGMAIAAEEPWLRFGKIDQKR